MSRVVRVVSTSALTTAMLGAGALPAAAAEPIATSFDASGPLLSSMPVAHASYRLANFRWPRGRISYYNAAKKDRWAVKKAVTAWNGSGARIRFIAARRSRAKVIIRYLPQRGCAGAGLTIPHYDARRRAVRARVLISRPVPTDATCSRWAIALTTAHELGHVLGLSHQRGRCAVMNVTERNLAPDGCKPRPLPLWRWRWRCRMLERDDVRGAVRLYGGRVKPRPRKAICDLSPPPRAPTQVTATVAPGGYDGLDIRFKRPQVTKQPAHLGKPDESYSISITPNVCASSAPANPVAWSVPPGGVELLSHLIPESGGSLCIAVWNRDAISGRTSQRAMTFVNYAPPPDGP